jgi:hypothetical protein
VLPAVSFAFASVAAATLIAGAPAGPPPPAYVAPCPSGVSGGLPADYERQSLLAGPLALYPVSAEYPRYPARYIASVRANLERDLLRYAGRLSHDDRITRDGMREALRHASDRRYPSFEAAATVRPGHTVTLAVAPDDLAHVGLLFDTRAWSHAREGYAIADGDAAVTFHGCTFPYTQFQGGFVADGPRCAHLLAWIDGAREPERRVVSFGAGDCGVPLQTRPGGPPPAPLTLGRAPAVERACRRAGLSRCPARWPLRPGSRADGGRDFGRGAARLLSFVDNAVEGEGGHLLLGERPRPYDLRGRPGEPFRRPRGDPLQIPSRRRVQPIPGGDRWVSESPARILRVAAVRGHRALVMRAPPYPRGGIHGDHAIVVWNEGGHGHLVSIHAHDAVDPSRYDERNRIAAAIAVADS